MDIFGPFQIASALIVLATSVAYFFTKLYHARMPIYNMQKKGLVSCSVFRRRHSY